MESPQDYYTSFQATRAAISSRLDVLVSSQPSPDQIAQIAHDIQVERKKLNEATVFLPTYDRQSYDSQLKELESRVDTLRNRNASAKGTFAFKKKAPSASKLTPAPPSPKHDSSPAPPPRTSPHAAPTIPSHQLTSSSHKLFTLSSLPSNTTISSTDLTITSLDHCIVDLLPPADRETSDDGGNLKLTALHIRDVKNSILLLGRIQGSILAHNLRHCIVVAACHQLRVHNSHTTHFHLHVSSSAIVEDSSSLSFSPYPSSLPLPPEIRQQRSTHTAIQDFSHLKSTPSPNWRAVPPKSSTSDSGSSPSLPPSESGRQSESEEKDEPTPNWDEIRALARPVTTTSKDAEEQKNELGQLLLKFLPLPQA